MPFKSNARWSVHFAALAAVFWLPAFFATTLRIVQAAAFLFMYRWRHFRAADSDGIVWVVFVVCNLHVGTT